jgi:hypothetical protein
MPVDVLVPDLEKPRGVPSRHGLGLPHRVSAGRRLLIGLSHTLRVVPAAFLNLPPSDLAVRARDLIARFGPPTKVRTSCAGFTIASVVDWIATHDFSTSRWDRPESHGGAGGDVLVSPESSAPLPQDRWGRVVGTINPERRGAARGRAAIRGTLTPAGSTPTGYGAPADSAYDWSALFSVCRPRPWSRFRAVPVQLRPSPLRIPTLPGRADPEDPGCACGWREVVPAPSDCFAVREARTRPMD